MGKGDHGGNDYETIGATRILSHAGKKMIKENDKSYDEKRKRSDAIRLYMKRICH